MNFAIVKACRILLVVLFYSLSSYSHSSTLYIASSETVNEKGETLILGLSKKLALADSVNVKFVSSQIARDISGENNLIVAIGSKSLKEVLSGQGNSPILAVFISKIKFESAVSKYGESNRRVTAVFSEASPVRQLALAKILYGANLQAVMVSSPLSHSLILDYKRSAKDLNLSLTIVDTDDVNSPSDFITLSKDHDALILVKDMKLFDRVSLDKILLSSYDVNRQGVIGYSKGIVKNGGAATTFSDLDDIVFSIVDVYLNVRDHNALIPPTYTKQYKVKVNKYILRSLDLMVPSSNLNSIIDSLVSESGSQL